jgi:hypothetical protein
MRRFVLALALATWLFGTLSVVAFAGGVAPCCQ